MNSISDEFILYVMHHRGRDIVIYHEDAENRIRAQRYNIGNKVIDNETRCVIKITFTRCECSAPDTDRAVIKQQMNVICDNAALRRNIRFPVRFRKKILQRSPNVSRMCAIYVR